MHNSRNRLALNSVSPGHPGHRAAKGWEPPLAPPVTAPSPFMLRGKGEPGFPEDVLIARPQLPGARIIALPDEPEPKAPVKKKATKTKAKRKPAKRKAASKVKAARPKKTPAKKAKSVAKVKAKTAKSAKPVVQELPAPPVQLLAAAPITVPEPRPVPQPSLGLLFAGGMAKVPASESVAAEHRVPILILPKNRSLTAPGQGAIARLVSWLGKLLPRKRRRASLPVARQALRQANLHR